MKIQQQIVIAIVSLFTVCVAHAQYYYGAPPTSAPPPPGYGPPPTSNWPWPTDTGPYFRAGIGPSFYQNGMLKGFSISAPATSGGFSAPPGTIHYDVGVSSDFSFGWAFNRYVSLGFQTGYTWAFIDSIDNYFVNNSDLGNIPFMANLTLSMPIPHSNVIPYIGGGIGGSDSILFANPIQETFTGNNNFISGSEDDVVFAWQASAGVRFKLNPNISVGVAYEYFQTGNPTFSYPPGPNLNAVFQGIRSHSVLFTFQANF